MKSLTLLLTTLFLFSSPVVWGEEVEYDDLVERDGLYYKKFSEEPYSGDVVGKGRGEVVKGKREGKWTLWSENGQLRDRGHWKNGSFVGKWEWLKEDGTLDKVIDYDG